MFSFVGLFVHNAATPFPASEFLRKHETEFFSVIDARLSLLRLKRKGVITQDVEAHINAATNEEDAQEILYDHLKRNANVDALKEYCEVAIAAKGHPNMQALGRKMKEELQRGGWVKLCVYLCMWCRCCVCISVHSVCPMIFTTQSIDCLWQTTQHYVCVCVCA